MTPLLLLIALVLVGCGEPSKQTNKTPTLGDEEWVEERQYKGHVYLIWQGYSGRGALIHAEHCNCKGGNNGH